MYEVKWEIILSRNVPNENKFIRRGKMKVKELQI